VVTNSTYDGLCYDVNRVVTELAQSVPRDSLRRGVVCLCEVPPIYRGRFAMDVPDEMPDRPAIFATQSTHKMLAAFSMASMVHIKLSPRAPLDFDQFNEAFMMHGTTSPFYPLIASLDVAAAMMDEPAGPTLMARRSSGCDQLPQGDVSIAHRLRAGWKAMAGSSALSAGPYVTIRWMGRRTCLKMLRMSCWRPTRVAGR
jgi:arginine decarboxylase